MLRRAWAWWAVVVGGWAVALVGERHAIGALLHRPQALATLAVLVLLLWWINRLPEGASAPGVPRAYAAHFAAVGLPAAAVLGPAASLLLVPAWALLSRDRRPQHAVEIWQFAVRTAFNGAANVLAWWAIARIARALPLPSEWGAPWPDSAAAATAAAVVALLVVPAHIATVTTMVRLASGRGFSWTALIPPDAARVLAIDYALGIALALGASAHPAVLLVLLPLRQLIRQASVSTDLLLVTRLDPKLRVFNRAHFDATLAAEHERAVRTGVPLGLLLLDLDRFKTLNDTHGHLAGDRALAAVCAAAQAALRPYDVFCRYGGEEFAIILPGADGPQSLAVAERVRAAVAAITPGGDGPPVPVTASIGATAFRTGTGLPDPSALLAEADQALYAAKDGGRNRVALAAAAERRAASPLPPTAPGSGGSPA